MPSTELIRPPLNLHIEDGAKTDPFAGCEMPVQYPPVANGACKQQDTAHLQTNLIDDDVELDVELDVEQDIHASASVSIKDITLKSGRHRSAKG